MFHVKHVPCPAATLGRSPRRGRARLTGARFRSPFGEGPKNAAPVAVAISTPFPAASNERSRISNGHLGAHLGPPDTRWYEARVKAVLKQRLDDLRAEGLLRDHLADRRAEAERAASALGRALLDFSGNDYLGLARTEHDVSANQDGTPGAERQPWGAGASRLVHGTHPTHRQFEKRFAQWLGHEDALLFASGYAANVGVLSALATSEDLVISDALNHASIVDGVRLSRARKLIVPHLDLSAVEAALAEPCAGQRWVVVESYYSMDGDGPDLVTLRALTRRFGAALIVDEAHALGTFGPEGRGLCAAGGVDADVVVGAFGKAFGIQGAAVAGPSELRSMLWNRARSFVYSTAVSPQLVHQTFRRLEKVCVLDERRARLAALSARLRTLLRVLPGITVVGEHGPIVPCVVGDSWRAMRIAERLVSRGVLVQAIRPPTVPAGTARLRLTVNALQEDQDLQLLTEELEGALCDES